MSSPTGRRGFDPDDADAFSPTDLVLLRKAQDELQWLLDRGYGFKSTMDLIGGHYQLTARQRSAIQRCTAPQSCYELRQAKLLPMQAIRNQALHVDGFNLIILLEVVLSGSPVLLGRDLVYRDLAGLRGTYRLLPQTDLAIELIGRAVARLSLQEVIFYLDQPVSNSGRLKLKILEHAASWDIPVQVNLVHNADAVLMAAEGVVSGDSLVLDQCQSWLNLSSLIIEEMIRPVWTVDLSRRSHASGV